MAMTINLTLVVQMVNFLIAYALLTKLLLKPGYEAVKSDENRGRQLRALIQQSQEKLAERQTYKKNRWQRCQDYFYTNKPVVEIKPLFTLTRQTLARPPSLSADELKELAHTINSKIKKKVLQ